MDRLANAHVWLYIKLLHLNIFTHTPQTHVHTRTQTRTYTILMANIGLFQASAEDVPVSVSGHLVAADSTEGQFWRGKAIATLITLTLTLTLLSFLTQSNQVPDWRPLCLVPVTPQSGRRNRLGQRGRPGQKNNRLGRLGCSCLNRPTSPVSSSSSPTVWT